MKSSLLIAVLLLSFVAFACGDEQDSGTCAEDPQPSPTATEAVAPVQDPQGSYFPSPCRETPMKKATPIATEEAR